MKAFRVVVLLMAATGIAAAQNSDLGLLLGGSHYPTTTRAGFQVNYAWQFFERPTGRLYIELPVILPVAPPHESDSPRLFFTPGIRYQFNLSNLHWNNRVALYVAAGGGVASRPAAPSTSWAYDFGGGVDVRLSRRWSLRGDVRDLATSTQTGFGEGNPFSYSRVSNHESIMIGTALHF